MPNEATLEETKPKRLTPAEDAARITAIRKLAIDRSSDGEEPIPESLVDYLVIKGFTVDDAAAAFDAWSADRHWRSPTEGVAWGQPTPQAPGD